MTGGLWPVPPPPQLLPPRFLMPSVSSGALVLGAVLQESANSTLTL